MPVYTQARREFVLGVVHLLSYAVWKLLHSVDQEIIWCFEGKNVLCNTDMEEVKTHLSNCELMHFNYSD